MAKCVCVGPSRSERSTANNLENKASFFGASQSLDGYQYQLQRATKPLLFKDVGNHFPGYLTDPLEHWWTEPGYTILVNRSLHKISKITHLQWARATRELEPACGRATIFSLDNAMERAGTLQWAVRCSGTARTMLWCAWNCNVLSKLHFLRAHVEVVDVSRPSLRVSLLAFNLSLASKTLRYSLTTMSPDFGIARCCLIPRLFRFHLFSFLAHSTHGTQHMEPFWPPVPSLFNTLATMVRKLHSFWHGDAGACAGAPEYGRKAANYTMSSLLQPVARGCVHDPDAMLGGMVPS